MVAHRGGGVGQVSDWWGNNYFDDTYFHNGAAQQHQGYCTDIWFDEATKFIQEPSDKPFFAYIATNAPHSPYIVDEQWSKPYEAHADIPYPGFYGMITQLDQRVGQLRELLIRQGIDQETLLIFMTDNGTSGGCDCDENGFIRNGFNAGMRGKKASYYDGGHRVACMMHYLKAVRPFPTVINDLCCDIDIAPTLIDYCGLPTRADAPAFDGRSLRPLLD